MNVGKSSDKHDENEYSIRPNIHGGEELLRACFADTVFHAFSISRIFMTVLILLLLLIVEEEVIGRRRA